jgi:hypothetical protein
VSGTFETLAILANVSALALYFGCALAAWRLRALDASARAEPGVLARLHQAAPWLACSVIAWLLTGTTRGEWAAFATCMVVAALVYAGTRGRRAAAALT